MAEDDDDDTGPGPVTAFWSGILTFGLVSIPVELYPAVRSSRVSLRLLGPDGHPLRRRYVHPGREAPLAPEDLVHGVEVEPGRFVTVTDQELQDLEPKKTREIDLRRFVDRRELDPVICDRPYFLLPQGEVDKPYRLLARTMEETGRAGIASFVLRGREVLVAIFAERGLLHAETLRREDEIRSAEQVGLPAPVEPDPAEVRELREAIDALAQEELDPDELVDERARALRALAEHRSEQELVHAPEEPEEGNVVDILEVLRERLAGASRAEVPEPSQPLQELSRKELYERAQEQQIPGRSKMSREELIKALG